MQDLNITVTNGTAFDLSNEYAVLNITVKNTNAIPCKAGTNAYYFVSLSDGTNTETYTFTVSATGTIAADTSEVFTAENSTLQAVTTSSGSIFYTAA